MRLLLASLLLAVPLLAQEKDATKEKPDPEPKRAQLERIFEKLSSDDPKVRAEAMEELRRLVPELRPGLSAVRVEKLEGGPHGIQVFVGSPGAGGETMNGTWTEDGRTGTYTLKSLGDGRYELKAALTGDGDAKRIEDKGTLAELRKNHSFLKHFMVLGLSMPEFRLRTGERSLVLDAVRPVVGVTVQPPSEALRHHLELVTGAGLMVDRVLPDSRAEKLGLRKFDILLRIDGEVVETPAQVKALANQGVTLEYIRRAKRKRLVTPAADD